MRKLCESSNTLYKFMRKETLTWVRSTRFKILIIALSAGDASNIDLEDFCCYIKTKDHKASIQQKLQDRSSDNAEARELLLNNISFCQL